MKRIWQFLSDLWRKSERDPWQFLQNLFYVVDKDPPAYVRSKNEADNKILDEWLEEYKGRITPEALEEYRRRVIKSVTSR
jgi:hypothetical protein